MKNLKLLLFSFILLSGCSKVSGTGPDINVLEESTIVVTAAKELSSDSTIADTVIDKMEMQVFDVDEDYIPNPYKGHSETTDYKMIILLLKRAKGKCGQIREEKCSKKSFLPMDILCDEETGCIMEYRNTQGGKYHEARNNADKTDC